MAETLGLFHSLFQFTCLVEDPPPGFAFSINSRIFLGFPAMDGLGSLRNQNQLHNPSKTRAFSTRLGDAIKIIMCNFIMGVLEVVVD